MRTIALLLVCACGAAPDKPMLANAPRPNTAAVAGGAAAAAAAITLASPDSANPEKKKPEVEKKPQTVKENVPSAVLDRLEKQPAKTDPKSKAQPAGPENKPKPPKDALDFGKP